MVGELEAFRVHSRSQMSFSSIFGPGDGLGVAQRLLRGWILWSKGMLAVDARNEFNCLPSEIARLLLEFKDAFSDS